MTRKIKDTDYLGISAQVRVMETRLLTKARVEQMLAAPTAQEAGKILQECGYPPLDPAHPEEMDAALSRVREQTLAELAGGAPDARYVDLFKLKYDYHNIKSLLKAQALGVPCDSMLVELGRVETGLLRRAVQEGAWGELPDTLAAAAAEGKQVLDTTRDPQMSDIVLDGWYYREMAQLAEQTGSAFLQSYVRTQIDAANLRCLVRTLRMGKTAEFLRLALLEGGTVAPDTLLEHCRQGGGELESSYRSTALEQAAQLGAEAARGGSMTEFERSCDNAVNACLADARLVPFGEAPLLAYLAARETEYTNIRILLLGRSAGLSTDVIRARLREMGI